MEVEAAIAEGEVSMYGSCLVRFERATREFCGTQHVLLTNTGTGSLHTALLALGIGKGDHVICPSFAYAASAFPVLYVGATPVFVDCDTHSWNYDLQALSSVMEEMSSKGRSPRALIAVHNYGMPCDMEVIMTLASKHEANVIEDAAEALGSAWNGQQVGTVGDVGVLSFNGNKILTTGGGGALLTDDMGVYSLAAKIAGQAKEDAHGYEHHQVGFNYQMGNLNAAYGLGQWGELAGRVSRRRSIFERYKSQLGAYDIDFQAEASVAHSNRWMTCAVFPGVEDRDRVFDQLLEAGIESKYLWKPLHQQIVFSGASFYGREQCTMLFERGLCLPSGSDLSEVDQSEIIDVVVRGM